MKTKIILTVALIVACSVLMGASSSEKTTVDKSVVVKSDDEALVAAKKYMDQGAAYISIHPKLRLFSETPKGEWEVEATFYN